MAIRTMDELLASLVRRVTLLERRLSRRAASIRSQVTAGLGIDVTGDGTPGTPYEVSVEPTVMRPLGRSESVTTQSGITTGETTINGISLSLTLTRATRVRLFIQLTTYSGNISDVYVLRVKRNVSTIVADWTRPANSSPNIAATGRTESFWTETDLAAGTHVLTLTMVRAAGSGTISTAPDALKPNRLAVDQIG